MSLDLVGNLRNRVYYCCRLILTEQNVQDLVKRTYFIFRIIFLFFFFYYRSRRWSFVFVKKIVRRRTKAIIGSFLYTRRAIRIDDSRTARNRLRCLVLNLIQSAVLRTTVARFRDI